MERVKAELIRLGLVIEEPAQVEQPIHEIARNSEKTIDPPELISERETATTVAGLGALAMTTITLPPLKNTTAADFYNWLRDEVLHLRAQRGDFPAGDFYQVTMPHVSKRILAEGEAITLRSDDDNAHSPPRVIVIQAVPMGQAVKLRFHAAEDGARLYLDVLLRRVCADFGVELPQAEQPNGPAQVKRSRGPAETTKLRAEVFKKLKEKHPEWGYGTVAMHAAEELRVDNISAETVRNAYRAMGWKWEGAARIR